MIFLSSVVLQDEESDRLYYISEVCNVQEKLDTFELIYGSDLIEYWYSIDMKDMFNTLIEILNKVIMFFINVLDPSNWFDFVC